MTLFTRVAELLKKNDAEDILVFGGGIIPDEDIPKLEEIGVAKIFQPSTTTTEIIDFLETSLEMQK
jgi:methylmalonyl-CoA mutase C-terminal domain/subunit